MIPFYFFYFIKGNKCTKKCNFVVILMTFQDLTYLLYQFGPTNCSTIWWAIKPMDLSVSLDFLGHIFYFTSSNTPLAIYNTRLFSQWKKNCLLFYLSVPVICAYVLQVNQIKSFPWPWHKDLSRKTKECLRFVFLLVCLYCTSVLPQVILVARWVCSLEPASSPS